MLAHSRSASRVCDSLASAYSFICRMSTRSFSITCHRRWHSSRPTSERCSALCRRALSNGGGLRLRAERVQLSLEIGDVHPVALAAPPLRLQVRLALTLAPLLGVRGVVVVRPVVGYARGAPGLPLAGLLGGSAAPRANTAGSAGTSSGAAPEGACAAGGAPVSIAGNGLVCISATLKSATPNDGCGCSRPTGARPSPVLNDLGAHAAVDDVRQELLHHEVIDLAHGARDVRELRGLAERVLLVRASLLHHSGARP